MNSFTRAFCQIPPLEVSAPGQVIPVCSPRLTRERYTSTFDSMPAVEVIVNFLRSSTTSVDTWSRRFACSSYSICTICPSAWSGMIVAAPNSLRPSVLLIVVYRLVAGATYFSM